MSLASVVLIAMVWTSALLAILALVAIRAVNSLTHVLDNLAQSLEPAPLPTPRPTPQAIEDPLEAEAQRIFQSLTDEELSEEERKTFPQAAPSTFHEPFAFDRQQDERDAIEEEIERYKNVKRMDPDA